MPAVLITVENLTHWDAVLPVLPWLDAAGVEIRALYHGLHPPKANLNTLAEALNLPITRFRWTRRVGSPESAMLLGTANDLSLLLSHRGPRPFIALPRLPLPAMLLRPPLPPNLIKAASESRVTPVGTLLNPEHSEHLPNLAVRTHGLPFLATGLPELDSGPTDDLSNAIVIVHNWNPTSLRSRKRESVARQSRALQGLLAPLLAKDFRIEMRPSERSPWSDDTEALAYMVRSIQSSRGEPRGRIAIDPTPGWPSLRNARAVLTLAVDTLLKGLAAGIERIWWLPSVLPSAESTKSPRPALRSCVIPDRLSYIRWVDDSGWDQPPSDGERVAGILGALVDGRASERTAQAILAALEA